MQILKNFDKIYIESEREIQKVEKITHLQITKNFDIIITETNKKAQKKKEVAIMTKREYFEKIKAMVTDNADLVAFVDAEIAKIDNRNEKAKAKRVAKTGDTADAVRAAVIKALEIDRPITLAELVAATNYPAGKVAYYIRPLIANGEVIKTKAKVDNRKIMTYRLAAEDEATV